METLTPEKPKLSVFEFTNYKEFLRSRLKDSWGLITKVAEASGCQRAYLSRVLTDTVHLTPDQAFNIAKVFALSPLESEYFMALVEYARAGSDSYREFMEKKIVGLRRQQQNLSRKIRYENNSTLEVQSKYYSSWHWSAIHVLVSIPQFQYPEAIAVKLQLPISLVHATLEELAKNGFVRSERGRWIHSSGTLHLAKESPFITYHHNNWRTRAVQDAQTKGTENIHFTIVQAMSREAISEIKKLVLDFVDETARVAGPSESEEVMCMNLDFFAV